MPELAAPAVVATELSVSLGSRQILQPLDLHLAPGQWCGVVGANGGGKSTLLKALAGLMPHRGEIEIHWQQPAPGEIGYMPQGMAVDAAMPVSVRDYLRLHSERRPVWRRDRLGAGPRALMERLEVSGFARQRIGSLSMGQHQRLMLCAALLREPQLLLLDEPLAGVDKAGRQLILSELQAFHRRGGGIVMVEHNWPVVAANCDRVAWVDGELKGFDRPAQIMAALEAQLSPFSLVGGVAAPAQAPHPAGEG